MCFEFLLFFSATGELRPTLDHLASIAKEGIDLDLACVGRDDYEWLETNQLSSVGESSAEVTTGGSEDLVSELLFSAGKHTSESSSDLECAQGLEVLAFE